MSDKCVVCVESAKAEFEWFCADCDKSFNDFLDEIGDETFLPNFIGWAAHRAREKFKEEILGITGAFFTTKASSVFEFHQRINEAFDKIHELVKEQSKPPR
jgi:hypothetical protein